METTTNTKIRPMLRTEEDLLAFKDCFERNNSPQELARLRWHYLDNPLQDLFVDLAVAHDNGKERIGGIYATFPVRAWISGDVVMAAQSLDTLTDADFRGKGLFKRLATSLYERCREQDVAFVYGFPNASSAFGFFHRLAWTQLDPVPYLLRPLRVRYFVRALSVRDSIVAKIPDIDVPVLGCPRLGPEQEIRVATSFGQEYDRLWEAFASGIRVAVHRDHHYLMWRLNRPQGNYKTLAYYSSGELKGFVTFCVRKKHGGVVGYIMEALYDPNSPSVGRALIAFALRQMQDLNADLALAWCLRHSPNYASYLTSGFLPLPERLRPIQLHFGVRALAAPPDAALGNRRNWYISYLDSDTV